MPLLILLLIPILGYVIFLWLNSIINGEIADLEVTAQEFCSSDFADNWVNAGLSLSQLNSACDEIRPVFFYMYFVLKRTGLACHTRERDFCGGRPDLFLSRCQIGSKMWSSFQINEIN